MSFDDDECMCGMYGMVLGRWICGNDEDWMELNGMVCAVTWNLNIILNLFWGWVVNRDGKSWLSLIHLRNSIDSYSVSKKALAINRSQRSQNL